MRGGEMLGSPPQPVPDATQQADFLSKAIEDIQGTIRALDVKASALLVVLAVPLAAAENLGEGVKALRASSSWLLWALVVAWAISLAFALLTLGAIANPAGCVPEEDRPLGTFYGATLFDVRLSDLTPWTKTKSRHSVSTWLTRCPGSPEAAAMELAFEQMKLAYIRDVKILRVRVATIALVVAIACFTVGALRVAGI